MLVSGRQSYYDADKKEQPAIRWLLEMMAADYNRAPAFHGDKVVRIDNDQVLRFLRLEPRDGFRYSMTELATPEIDKLQALLEKHAAMKKDEKYFDHFDTKIRELEVKLRTMSAIARHQTPNVVPPPAEQRADVWVPLIIAQEDAPDSRLYLAFRAILVAYGQGNATRFNAALKSTSKSSTQFVPERQVKWALKHFSINSHLSICARLFMSSCSCLFSPRGWYACQRRSGFNRCGAPPFGLRCSRSWFIPARHRPHDYHGPPTGHQSLCLGGVHRLGRYRV